MKGLSTALNRGLALIRQPLIRRSRLARPLTLVLAGTLLATCALAIPPVKPKKKAEHAAETPPAPPPVVPTPENLPQIAPTPASTTGTTPVPDKPAAEMTPEERDATAEAVKARTEEEKKPDRSIFEGFFLNLNLGYGLAGGTDGPVIPPLQQGSTPPPAGTPDTAALKALSPTRYDRAVTTNRGSGVAAGIQIGYNIKGYVSIWADLGWHGTFGSTADLAGGGTASAIVGFHPLRFAKNGQLPIDVKLYGGYGFFDINYYYEAEFQIDAKGKAWTGTAIPFGLSSEYKFDKKGVFAMGLDLRFVRASYDKWIYNNDKDIASHLTTPETTLRFEPKLMFGWHF